MTENAKTGPHTDKERLAQLEHELEVIRSIHIKAIVQSGGAGGVIDDDLLKKIASYLKVVEKLASLIIMREKESDRVENSLAVKTVWQAMAEVPELKPLLSDPKVKAKILKQVRKKIAGKKAS